MGTQKMLVCLVALRDLISSGRNWAAEALGSTKPWAFPVQGGSKATHPAEGGVLGISPLQSGRL